MPTYNEKKEVTLTVDNSKEEHCLRCGISRKDIRAHHYECQEWGTIHDKHLYK